MFGYAHQMETGLLRFLLFIVAGFLERKHADALAYVLEENRVLREQVGGRRVRLTDVQRRRLGRKGRLLSRSELRRLAKIATLETILGWYRRLVARKYDGSKGVGWGDRGPGRTSWG